MESRASAKPKSLAALAHSEFARRPPTCGRNRATIARFVSAQATSRPQSPNASDAPFLLLNTSAVFHVTEPTLSLYVKDAYFLTHLRIVVAVLTPNPGADLEIPFGNKFAVLSAENGVIRFWATHTR